MAKRPNRRKKSNYCKKKRSSSRDFQDPVYKIWRNNVKTRDGYRCQWPGCLSDKRLEVHHIKTWGNYPALRYTTANGITLCHKCHKDITGKEHDFEAFFLKLLEWQVLDKIKEYQKRNKE